MEAKEYECEMMRELCGCEDEADDDYCEYYCYNDYGFDFSECRNDENNREDERYGECRDFNVEDYIDDDDNARRQLEDEEDRAFLGPYCAKTSFINY